VVLVLTVDLTGSTPVLKSGLHPDRSFRVTLDTSRCRGAGTCEQVCPRDCFHVDQQRRRAALDGAERCVRCGACIVQCPCDALSFTGPEGERVLPETVRRYKLNLMGQRAKQTNRDT
jgi:NAD-dependent dihydropyrimidine dehydrogenase PreA subunit